MRKPDAIQLFKALPYYDLAELARVSAPLRVALDMLGDALREKSVTRLPPFSSDGLELALFGYVDALSLCGAQDNGESDWHLRAACECMISQLFPYAHVSETCIPSAEFSARRVAALVVMHYTRLVKEARLAQEMNNGTALER
jgi:hypothetical protein